MSISIEKHRQQEEKTLTEKEIRDYLMQSKIATGTYVDLENPNSAVLAEEIAKKGAIPFSRYMEVALFGPAGYYTHQAEIGVDFKTSATESPFFGAGCAMVARKIWESMGKPSKFDVVEVGAGTAQLARGFLDYLRQYDPAFYQAVSYQIVETSPHLITQQEALLYDHPSISWHKGSVLETELPEIEGLFLSNELVDAFTVERVALINGLVQQKFVTLETVTGEWIECWRDPESDVLDFIQEYKINLQEGFEIPLNIASTGFIQKISQQLKKGAILTIDYSIDYDNPPNVNSVRSQNQYRRKDQLLPIDECIAELYKNPGGQDLTASVPFHPMNVQAEREGLTTALNSTQNRLLRAVDLKSFVFPLLERRWEELTTDIVNNWDDLLVLQREVKGFSECVNLETCGHFHSQLLLRGIDPQSIPFTALPEEDSVKDRFDATMLPLLLMYTYIHTRQPTTYGELSVFNRLTGTTLKGRVDMDGNFKIPIDQLEGTIIKDEHGNELLNIVDRETLLQMIKKGIIASSISKPQ